MRTTMAGEVAIAMDRGNHGGGAPGDTKPGQQREHDEKRRGGFQQAGGGNPGISFQPAQIDLAAQFEQENAKRKIDSPAAIRLRAMAG